MKRILITGASGMLGRDIQGVLATRPYSALGHVDLDVRDIDSVRRAVAGHDVIINCAAYTRVDDAENHEAEAFSINAEGAYNLALAARSANAQLVHISTDYVFDGSATTPYPEDAPRNPLGAYSRTKAAAEELVLDTYPERSIIVRSAWLYGLHGANFVSTILELARERETLNVVDDQQGQPTWTHDLAAKIIELIDAGVSQGIFHATSTGQTSWYGFARLIFRLAELDPDRVRPTSSSSFSRPAARPAYSVLGHEAWARHGLTPIRPWESALSEALPMIVHASRSTG